MILDDLLNVFEATNIGAIQYKEGQYKFKEKSNDVIYYDLKNDKMCKMYESRREVLESLKDKKISSIIFENKFSLGIVVKD